MTDQERRQDRRRCTAEDHGIVRARIRPGHDAQLIDISGVGALVETARRLLPGASVELQVETREQHTTVRGSIVRCLVSRVRASSMSYRGAIAFDQHLPWFIDPHGYDVPGADMRAARISRGLVTPQVV